MSALNLLVAGHRSNRLPEDALIREKLIASLRASIIAFKEFADSGNRRLRLISGDAPGADAWVKDIARELRVESLSSGVSRPPDGAMPDAPGHEQGIWLFEQAIDGNATDSHYAAIDEAKLFYADMLVVVWDGAPPQGHGGGTVRLLIEAVRQRKPVLWIDATVDGAGQWRWVSITALDTPSITLVDADERNVVRLRDHFKPLPHTQVELRSLALQLEAYLLPEPAEAFRRLWEKWDRGESPVKAGWLHSASLRLFGYPRIEGGHYESYPVAGFEAENRECREGFWERYHALDRAAQHAAWLHRDQIVLTHFSAAFAVLCAVAGSIAWDGIWGVLEFLVLAIIALTVWIDRRRDVTAHQAYLQLRHGAETFRVLSVLRPFLACLPRIERNQWAAGGRTSGHGFDLITPQTWWVLRWLRDEGPPRCENDSAYTPVREVGVLKSRLIKLIEDQRGYHHRTHERWHKIHERIEWTIKTVFALIMATVTAHLFSLASHHAEYANWPWWPDCLFALGYSIHSISPYLLLITAAGPALAASLHGIAGKLEIARISNQSKAMQNQLDVLRKAVETIDATGDEATANFMTLRALAIQTANVLYAEHEAWVALLHGQDLEIPA